MRGGRCAGARGCGRSPGFPPRSRPGPLRPRRPAARTRALGVEPVDTLHNVFRFTPHCGSNFSDGLGHYPIVGAGPAHCGGAFFNEWARYHNVSCFPQHCGENFLNESGRCHSVPVRPPHCYGRFFNRLAPGHTLRKASCKGERLISRGCDNLSCRPTTSLKRGD